MAEEAVKSLPSHNPLNFSKFKSDSKSTKKKLTPYISTQDRPTQQVIVSDRSNILLRYLYLQLGKKWNENPDKRKTTSKDGKDNELDTNEDGTGDNISEHSFKSEASSSDGPPRKLPRMSEPGTSLSSNNESSSSHS